MAFPHPTRGISTSAAAALFAVLMIGALGPAALRAQDTGGSDAAGSDAAGSDAAGSDAAGPSAASGPASGGSTTADDPAKIAEAERETRASKKESPSLIDLIVRGGAFMIPIALMSVLVVVFVIERLLSLRRSKVIPEPLISGLGQLSASGNFDPRAAYRLCQRHPSAAGNVVRSMLLKVGRPHSEVEHTVTEASEREADRLNANVGWLNLAAAVTPLMGLLGTVWGLITAFIRLANLEVGADKAEVMSKGIYTALVTTLGGLVVAIPAAIFAHFFEGRIRKLFHEIDELLFNLMPQVERYEGRLRVSQQSLKEPPTPADLPSPSKETVAAASAAASK